MQPFETSRLILRDPLMTDLEPFTEMWSDSAVAEFMDDYGPREAVGVQKWRAQIVAAEDDRQGQPSSVQLMLARKEDGVVVG